MTRTLDLGCGDNKRDADAVGVDIRDYPAVDVVADIEDGLPFDDGRFERVLAYSVLEHVDDLPRVMSEIHRVLQPGGVLEGKVPYWEDRTAHIDPTHVRGFDTRTFDYWDSTTRLGALDYFDAEFRIESVRRVRRIQFWRSRPIQFELRAIPVDEDARIESLCVGCGSFEPPAELENGVCRWCQEHGQTEPNYVIGAAGEVQAL